MYHSSTARKKYNSSLVAFLINFQHELLFVIKRELCDFIKRYFVLSFLSLLSYACYKEFLIGLLWEVK